MIGFFSKHKNIFFTLVVFFLTAHFLRFCWNESWFNENVGLHDWDQHFFYLESVRKPIVEFGTMPFWNPYYLGGIPILENPQIKFFTPETLLALLFGGILGLKFSILLYFFLGCAGCIYLFRFVLKFSIPVSMLSTVLILYSGWLPQHIFVGHSQFISAPIITFLIAFWFRFKESKNLRFLFLSSLVLAFLLWDGNVYFYLYSNFIILLGIVYFAFLRNWNMAFGLIGLVVLSFFLSAYRLLPELSYLWEFGAYFRGDQNFLSATDIWKIFTIGSQHPYLARNFSDQEYNWWEYGNYISAYPFYLGLISVAFIKKEDIKYLFLLGILFVLMMGNFSPYSLTSILSNFPGYSNLRCHGRWGYLFVVGYSVILGIVLQRKLTETKEIDRGVFGLKIHSYLYLGILVFSLFLYYDLSKTNSKIIKDIFSVDLASIQVEKSEDIKTVQHLPGYGSESSMLPGIKNNISILHGYENLLVRGNVQSIQDKGYIAEHYLSNGRRIDPIYWAPGKIVFSRDQILPGDRIVINQNFHSSWKLVSGGKLEEWEGKMSILVASGKEDIEIYYSNIWFWIGAFMGLVAIATMAWINFFNFPRIISQN